LTGKKWSGRKITKSEKSHPLQKKKKATGRLTGRHASTRGRIGLSQPKPSHTGKNFRRLFMGLNKKEHHLKEKFRDLGVVRGNHRNH